MRAKTQPGQQARGPPIRPRSRRVAHNALDLLEKFGSTVVVERSSKVHGEGSPTEFCWQIVSGCVRTVTLMEDGRRQIGEFLWPGDLIGLDDPVTHTFEAEAATDLTLRRYPRRMVEELAQRRPALALRLRTVAAANLSRAYQQMMLLARKTALEKMASFLLEMDRRSPATTRRPVPLPMSRTDIADHLCVRAETVSRILYRLQCEGIIAISRSGIELCDRAALHELARESSHRRSKRTSAKRRPRRITG